MKSTKYECDRKLKIYDHMSFYEANLKRAKKLYCPNSTKNVPGRKKLYETSKKTNVNNLIKKYYADIQKMKKKDQLKGGYEQEENENFDEREFLEKKEKIKNLMNDDENEDVDYKFLLEKVSEGKRVLKGKKNEKDYEMRVNGEELSDDNYDEYYDNSEVGKDKQIESLTDIHNSQNEKESEIHKEPEKKEDVQKENEEKTSKSKDTYPFFSEIISSSNEDYQSDINKLSQSIADKLRSYYQFKEITENENEDETENEKMQRELFQNQTDKEAYEDYQTRVLDNLKNTSIDINDEEAKLESEKQVKAQKIQKKFRKNQKEKEKPDEKKKIFRGWDKNEKNVISIYIYKTIDENVISLYVKIYSVEKMINYIEILTLPELKNENVIDYDKADVDQIKQDKDNIAQKLLDVYEKKRFEERQKEINLNTGKSNSKKEIPEEDDENYSFDHNDLVQDNENQFEIHDMKDDISEDKFEINDIE